ncbi:MFS transporter [Dictyobacter arantiisoli]|uniref:Major facilitator superfamily (MFS) profile domain-containing protein n=1 Tax=Dictyobacter arantiisoli TaxID=2014874 RepID=A0A5A5TBB8_9CHLR|nr:MFS transporter [Dictyobacter arantiisoli]GCF08732.1 hypothetical protein KDI_22960 [Dictyobacter arantiisoli]
MKDQIITSRQRSFMRDRFTWLAYALLACYAYLQNSPGLLVPFIHADMHLDYTVDSMHLSSLALGGIIAGLIGAPVTARWGRQAVLWGGALGMLFGAGIVFISHYPIVSITGMFVIGFLGALVGMTVQSTLSDHHGQFRAVAIVEANMLASLGAGIAPLLLGGLVVLGFGWRSMLFLPVLVVVLLVLFNVRIPVPEAPQSMDSRPGQRSTLPRERVKLPGAFWLYWIAMVAGIAGEWGVSFWGANYMISVVGMPKATAASLMTLFFLASVIGRLIASRLTRRIAAERLILPMLGIAIFGFLLFWLGSTVVLHISGLFVAGLGIANLFPLNYSAAANRIPQYADIASARATVGGGIAMFVCPLILGRLGDMLGLRIAFSVIFVFFVLTGIFVLFASRATRRLDAVPTTHTLDIISESVITNIDATPDLLLK